MPAAPGNILGGKGEGRGAVDYTIEVAVAVVQLALGFYGFWLVWRVLLPDLPGPADRDDRVAPYVWYFTDPFIVPVAKALHVPARLMHWSR